MENFEDEEEDPVIEGYTIDVQFIKQAWAKYRPVQDTEETDAKQENIRDIKQLFPEIFVAKLISNLNLKIYQD